MAILGIDLGNHTSVVAAAQNRSIDIVLNRESQRETPSVVSIGPHHRLIGSSSYSTTSISHLKLLLSPDASPLIHVDEHRTFTPTQMLAMLLSHLRSLAETHLHSAVADCCIAIPSHFTDPQRRAVLDAATIAGLNPLRLIHETTAAALEYGIYRSDLREGEFRNVAFVDVGFASTQVCVVCYTKGQLRVLSHAFDRSLGGKDFDEVLFRHFAVEFQKQTGIELASNAHACARLLSACEKVKKVLSANWEANLNLECLAEDKDFRSLIKRQDFERMSESILERVKGPLEKAIVDAGLCIEDVHKIEIVGSGSRIPAIVGILKDFFGKEPVRTLNARECVARGCALQGAMLIPTFRVREFEVHETFPFTVDVLWELPLNILSNEQLNKETSHLFFKGDPIPMTKTVQLFGGNSFSVDLVYADATALGGQKTISTYMIGPCQLFEGETAAFELEFTLNIHGIVSLRSVTMVEEIEVPIYTEMETVVEASNMPTEGIPNHMEDAYCVLKMEGAKGTINCSCVEVEDGLRYSDHFENMSSETYKNVKVEIVKETKRTSIKFSECVNIGFSPVELRQAIEEEREMLRQDRLMEDTKDRKNSVEVYIYDMRNKIREEYRDFVGDLERETLVMKLQEAEDWLYGEGENVSEETYKAKLNELKEIGDLIVVRFREDLERTSAIKQLFEYIHWYQDSVTRNEPQFEHIDLAEREKILDACQKAEAWLQERLELQNSLSKHENPVLLSSDIRMHIHELDSFCRPIMSKPRSDPCKRETTPAPEDRQQSPPSNSNA